MHRTYIINHELLTQYMHTPAAIEVHKEIQGNANKLCNRDLVQKLLATTKDGGCVVKYRFSNIYNKLELRTLGLTHSRVYPNNHYSCVFACLPKALRGLALHRDYAVFDMSKCYHRVALGLTQDESCKQVLQDFLCNGAAKMQEVADFYQVDIKTVKLWFHQFSNNKQRKNWLEENKLESTHAFIDSWITVQNQITDEMCARYPDAYKALGEKATLRSYVNQMEEGKARQAMEEYFHGTDLGPPMHDAISVLKHGLDVTETAQELTKRVSAALGYEMVIEHEPITIQRLPVMTHFAREDFDLFRHNPKLLLEWCSRYFVCMTQMSDDIVVELQYKNSNEIKGHVARTSTKTCNTHPGMLVQDEQISLLRWYMQTEHRREAERIGVYFTKAIAAQHPRDLNVFAGLPFDKAYESEDHERVPFKDPFDKEPDWKQLDGVDFILWHMKYNLHGGDGRAFHFSICLDAWAMQHRMKPGVLVLLTSVQGTGKSAVYGWNESGPGLYPRMYGDAAHQYNNVDTLLKDFNADSMGKLYCLLEEANPGNNTRNNNQLKDIITGGKQRIERKGVDAFTVDDARMFKALSQDVPFKIEQGDRRYVVNRGREDFSPTGVANGLVSQTDYREFCTKLNRIKNSDDVAYEFFCMLMSCDLSDFDKTDLPVTDAKTEMQRETGCRVAMWIEKMHALECVDDSLRMVEFIFMNDEVRRGNPSPEVFPSYTAYMNYKKSQRDDPPPPPRPELIVKGLAPARLGALYENFKAWHARAFPGSWMEPRSENAFAKALHKTSGFSTVKTNKCNKYIIHTILDGGEILEEEEEILEEVPEEEIPVKRQKC